MHSRQKLASDFRALGVAPGDVVLVHASVRAVGELLRTYSGSLVNDHVTRFVVWGKQARHLISRQPWDFAFGRDSALEFALPIMLEAARAPE